MDDDTIVFYFIRHGQTDWNLDNKIQGHTDVPLNKKGLEQAGELKKKLTGIVFAKCFSSDLQRASKTAQIIMKENPAKIVLDKRLRERNFRDMEGKSSTAYINASPQDLDNIETDEALSARVFQFLDEVINTYLGGNILIVSHGGVMRSVLSKVLSLTCRDVEIEIGNMAIMKLLFTHGEWHVEELSDIRWT